MKKENLFRFLKQLWCALRGHGEIRETPLHMDGVECECLRCGKSWEKWT